MQGELSYIIDHSSICFARNAAAMFTALSWAASGCGSAVLRKQAHHCR